MTPSRAATKGAALAGAVALLAAGAIAFPGCSRPDPARPAPESTAPLPPLSRGLRLTLGVNLHGVNADDVSERARRHVEVLAFDGRSLTLRWSGRVLVEGATSARRRAEWLRGRGREPAGATPAPVETAVWEERVVGGTLTFPDFATARSLLLPGLWPEGTATLPGSTAIWLQGKAREDLATAGAAWIPFLSSGPSLVGPASELLARAATLHVEPPGADPDASPSDLWRVAGRDGTASVRVGGARRVLPVLRAKSWLGRYEVLGDAANPLVLSVLPEPPSSQLLDLFSPARVLQSLLGYRVLEIESRVVPGR